MRPEKQAEFGEVCYKGVTQQKTDFKKLNKNKWIRCQSGLLVLSCFTNVPDLCCVCLAHGVLLHKLHARKAELAEKRVMLYLPYHQSWQ